MLKKIIPLIWFFFAIFGIWKASVLADNVNLKKSQGVFNSAQVKLISKDNISNYQIIDIRDREYYSTDYIYGSVNIPSGELLYNHNQLDKDISYIITGDDLKEMSSVVRFLKKEGFSVFFHQGGLKDWKGEGFPTFSKF